MKKIEAYIQQEKIKNIKAGLNEVFRDAIAQGKRREGYPGLTIYNVEGKGAEYSTARIWGGRSFEVNVFPRTKLEIVVVDEDLEKTIGAVVSGCKKGSKKAEPQGKIFVYDIADVVRIRDEKRGEEVIK